MDEEEENTPPVFAELPKRDYFLINDWNYAMRRAMQEVLPGLYLGPYACAAKNQQQDLKTNGITHIICIRHVMEQRIIKPNFPDNFKYLVLDISDTFDQNIIQFLPLTKAFIEEAIQSQGKVLVHGNGGISRSGAIVIGYVMEKHGVTYKEAFQHVQSKRFCVNPNVFFVQQLEEYEPIFRARLCGPKESKGIDANDGKAQVKRKFEEDDTVMDAVMDT